VNAYLADKTRGALQTHNGTVELELIKKEQISPDTYNFHFKLPSKDQEFGLHIGGHVFFLATLPSAEHPEGEEIHRKYTPIGKVHDKGTVVFPIKVYWANTHPDFPEGGKMTQYLDNLKLGHTVKMQGPKGKLEYLGNGKFVIKNNEGKIL